MKTQKLILIFLAFVGAMLSINANAQGITFSETVDSGQRLWFYLPEDSVDSVTVCAPNTLNWDGFELYKPMGNLIIPSKIDHNGGSFYVKSIMIMAFNGCDGLQSVEISDGISTIGMYAFQGCSRLKSVIVGADVRFVQPYAFVNCTRMEYIKSKSIDMREFSPTPFEGVPTNIPVYIPCGTKSMYEEVWDYFPSDSFVEELEMTCDVSLSVNSSWQGEAEITEWGTCENPYVEITATPNSGYRFDHWNDGNTENPRIVQLVSDTTLVAYFGLNNSYIIGNSNVAIGCSGGSFVDLPLSAYAGDTVCFSISMGSDSKIGSLVVKKGDGPNEVVPFLVENNTGHYYCFVMPDSSVSVQVTFVANTGVDEKDIIPVSIYPNPVKDRVTIETESVQHISISNMMGQLVFEGAADGDSFEYDFSGQEAGVYLIRIETSNGTLSKQIIVIK